MSDINLSNSLCEKWLKYHYVYYINLLSLQALFKDFIHSYFAGCFHFSPNPYYMASHYALGNKGNHFFKTS